MLGLRGVKAHNPPSFLILWRLKGRQKLKFPRHTVSPAAREQKLMEPKNVAFTPETVYPFQLRIQNCSVCFQISQHAMDILSYSVELRHVAGLSTI